MTSFNPYFIVKHTICNAFIFITVALISPDIFGINCDSIYPKRKKVTFLISDSLKNDSANQIIRKLLLENNQIIRETLSLQGDLAELEEAIRLQEIYESIQTQQTINESTENLKRSIKKRTYFSLGIGLISSSLLFIGDGNSNDNIRYGGAILSLSIPIITIISMKRQLNTLVPNVEIDYSMLQSGTYPHNQASRDFFRNYVKAELFALKDGLQRLAKINVTSLNKLNNDNDPGYLIEVSDNTNRIIRDLENYYVFQIQKFNNIVMNDYITAPLNGVSGEKLQQMTRVIQDKLENLQQQKPTLLSNQKHINQLLENNTEGPK
ncbi:hypothetical protein QQ020_34170 [Fulvivirgaceae bacterium BMA12]|uniref:Uncharacterized protein n=1 Tax=Agaribacillus aureus TaxID=3051825 RepID=A0ABT8LH80_9BACT|nr:hypothetical protein [Fulvivirgaceae bacterium BMA12]